MKGIEIRKGLDGRIIVSFKYNPTFIEKIKTIKGYRWYPKEKYWSFPNTNGILEKILKIFEGEEIHIDSALQDNLPKTKIEIPNQGQITESVKKELKLRGYS